MEKLYNFIGGRKLTFALILTILATVFVWFNKASSEQWIGFMQWVFGIYASGNATEHIAKALKKK